MILPKLRRRWKGFTRPHKEKRRVFHSELTSVADPEHLIESLRKADWAG
jgi:hypothetical protein